MATTQIFSGFGFASYGVNVQGIQAARQDAVEANAQIKAARDRLNAMQFSSEISRIDGYIEQTRRELHLLNVALGDFRAHQDKWSELVDKIVVLHNKLTEIARKATAIARRLNDDARAALNAGRVLEAEDLLQQSRDVAAEAESASQAQQVIVSELQKTQAASSAALAAAQAAEATGRATVARLKAAQKTAVNQEMAEQMQRALELIERLVEIAMQKRSKIDSVADTVVTVAKGAAYAFTGILLLLAAAWAISMRPKRRTTR